MLGLYDNSYMKKIQGTVKAPDTSKNSTYRLNIQNKDEIKEKVREIKIRK
jgi:hypothetical protein